MAQSVAGLQRLLNAAAGWAAETGTTFAPQKCEWLARKGHGLRPADVDVHMNGVVLRRVERYRYLGMWMGLEGVDMGKSLEERVKKAKRMVSFLKVRGFNSLGGSGFRPVQSLRHLSSFVRSMLEYGQALRPLSAEEEAVCGDVQTTALRTMFSVGRSTSKASLHVISGLTPVAARAQLLNAAYLFRLHHCTDARNLTAHVLRWSATRRPSPVRRSLLLAAAAPGTAWAQLLPTLDPLATLDIDHPLAPDDAPPPVGFAKSGTPALEDDFRSRIHTDALFHMAQSGTARTAKIIPVLPLRSRHPAVACRDLARTDQRLLVLWMLGRVCMHQPCRACADAGLGVVATSREHGIACAGVDAGLRDYFADLEPHDNERQHGATVLDLAIHRLDYHLVHRPKGGPASWIANNVARVRAVTGAIERIRGHCLGQPPLTDVADATAEEEADAIIADDDDDGHRDLLDRVRRAVRETHEPEERQLAAQRPGGRGRGGGRGGRRAQGAGPARAPAAPPQRGGVGRGGRRPAAAPPPRGGVGRGGRRPRAR